MQIQLFNVSTKITRQEWLPIGAIMGALILAAIGAAYVPAIADAPLHAQLSGALCIIVAALAAVGIFLPKISGPKMAVQYEAEGSIVRYGSECFGVLSDGITFDKNGNPVDFRHPDIALRWQVVSFFRRYPYALPGLVALAAIFSILLIWAEAANPGSNPFAEQAIWLFPMLTKAAVMLANCILLLLAVLSIIALFGVPVVREIAHEIRQQAAIKPGVALLGSGENLEGLAAPYKMVCSRRSETPSDFLARVVEVRKQSADNYVVAVPMGTDIVAIACPADTDSPTATEISEERTTFVQSAPPSDGESFEVYAEFIRIFAPNVRKWIFAHHAKTSGGFAALKAAMQVSCLLLAFCMVGLAQPKSVQVAAYMGDRHPVASQGVDVLFSFQNAVLRRTGDGAKTVQQLLQDGLAFSDDDNAGFLKEIFIGGTKIPPAARPTANANLGAESARPLPTGKSVWDEIPDSAKLEGYKSGIESGIRAAGRQIAPRWNFILFVFWKVVLPILVFICVIAYFIAKAAFKEMSNRGNIPFFSKPVSYWGYQARNTVWLCSVLVGVVLLADGLICDFFAGNSLWGWLLWSVLKMFALYKIVTWVTPNPPANAGFNRAPIPASNQLPDGF